MNRIGCDFYEASDKFNPETYSFEGLSESSKVLTISNSFTAHSQSHEIGFTLKKSDNQERFVGKIKEHLQNEGFDAVTTRAYDNEDFIVQVALQDAAQFTQLLSALSKSGPDDMPPLMTHQDAVGIARAQILARAQAFEQKKALGLLDPSADTAGEISSLSLDEIYDHGSSYSQQLGSPRYYDAHMSRVLGGSISKLEEHGSHFVADITTTMACADPLAAEAIEAILKAKGVDAKRLGNSEGIELHGRLDAAFAALHASGVMPEDIKADMDQKWADSIHRHARNPAATVSNPAPVGSKL